jgi:hypothetical protein
MELELFPIACGLLTGALVGRLRPSLHLPFGAALAIVFGVAATVLTGEAKMSWGYVLVDIPLVAVAAGAANVFVRTHRLASAQSTGERS